MSTPQRSRHSQIYERETQSQSIDIRRSHAGSSGSEDPAPSSKKPRDGTTYLKYLVRGFLRQFRATSRVKDTTREKFPNKDSFVPSPKITFLIDEPPSLECQICQQTPLRIGITAEDPVPRMPVILPCGHICCHECSHSWLASQKTCPFCRTSMVHPSCGHQVQPRLIAMDTIHTLPETLANGGAIGDMCFKCTEKDMRQKSVKRLMKLAERFKRARREAEDLGTKEAIEDMRRAQDAFESLPEDDFLALSRIRHHQW